MEGGWRFGKFRVPEPYMHDGQRRLVEEGRRKGRNHPQLKEGLVY